MVSTWSELFLKDIGINYMYSEEHEDPPLHKIE